MYKSQGWYKGKNFAEVIESETSVVDLSLQGKHLARIYELFEKDQVLVLSYDELSKSPQVFLNKVCDFLEIEPFVIPKSHNKKVNKVVFPRTQAFLKALKLKWLIQLLRRSVLFTTFVQKAQVIAKSAAASSVKGSAAEKLFEDDVRLLEKLTNLDLGDWRK